MAAAQEELASLQGDAAAQEIALDSMQRRAMVQSNRQELIAAGATVRICELLAAGGGDKNSESRTEGSEPRIMGKAMDVLAVLCCDDQSRQEAVEAGAIAAVVNIAHRAVNVVSGAASVDTIQHWSELRVCTVKTLLNFTQGATKALAPILASTSVLIDSAAFYEAAAGERDGHGQLRLYALMALTNLANGGDEQQGVILKGGVGEAIARAIEAKKGEAAQALKLLLLLCAHSAQGSLVSPALARALASSLAAHRTALLAGGARDALRSTTKAVALLAFGDGRDDLIRERVPEALAHVIAHVMEEAAAHRAPDSPRSPDPTRAPAASSPRDAADVVDVRLWVAKALERFSKCPQALHPLLLQQGAVEALIERVRRGRLEEQEYALRALVTLCGGGPGAGVARFVAGKGLDAVKGLLERCCEADTADEDGLDDAAIKALHLVTLACRVDEAAQRQGCALLTPLSRIAQSRDSTLQDLAVKGLLNLGRAGEDAKAKLATSDVLLSLTSLVRVEGGTVQLNAIKTLYHISRFADCHAPLLEHGAASPLLEVCEVADGDALSYALRALQSLCAGKPPIRTHLLRCDALPVLVRCGRGAVLADRSAALECLANLAKDNTVAPLMTKAGVVDLAVETLRKGDVHEQVSCLLLLQRLSTASRILHALVSAGVIPAVTGVLVAEKDEEGGEDCALMRGLGCEGASTIRDDILLLAGLCVAPLLDSGSAVPDVPPRLWRLLRAALEQSASSERRGVSLHTEEPPTPPSPATADAPLRRTARLSLFEMLLALRHFASHKICRPALLDAGVCPLLASVVVNETRDPSLPALAAQALYEMATDRHIQTRIAKQLQDVIGEEYLGHLALAANRLRPQSPDELDMLLVM